MGFYGLFKEGFMGVCRMFPLRSQVGDTTIPIKDC